MAWIYNVITKKFSRNGDYKFSAEYAGSPGYKDNPDDECVKNKGLLPRGNYHITGPIAVQEDMLSGLRHTAGTACAGVRGF